MSSNDKYVRVTPYNKNIGALANRVSIDGKLFVGGQWYSLPAEAADKLARVKQKTGAPMFEICSHAEFREASRRDLAAMAAAAGIKGLALAPQEAPKPRKHQDKSRKSKLAGIGKAVKDVEVEKIDVVPQVPVEPEPIEEEDEPIEDDEGVEEEEVAEEVDETVSVDKMKRPALLKLCKDNGVDIPFGSSNPELRKLLRDNGIVE